MTQLWHQFKSWWLFKTWRGIFDQMEHIWCAPHRPKRSPGHKLRSLVKPYFISLINRHPVDLFNQLFSWQKPFQVKSSDSKPHYFIELIGDWDSGLTKKVAEDWRKQVGILCRFFLPFNKFKIDDVARYVEEGGSLQLILLLLHLNPQIGH